MSKYNANLAVKDDDTPELAPQDRSEGERLSREFPIALAMYVGDIHCAIHSAGVGTLTLNAAMLAHDLSAMQRCAELIATEANTANVLSEKIAKKVAEMRRRNPM